MNSAINIYFLRSDDDLWGRLCRRWISIKNVSHGYIIVKTLQCVCTVCNVCMEGYYYSKDFLFCVMVLLDKDIQYKNNDKFI